MSSHRDVKGTAPGSHGTIAAVALLVSALSGASGASAQSSTPTPQAPPAPDARDEPAQAVSERPWRLGVLAPLDGPRPRRESPSPWRLDLSQRGACPPCGDATSLVPRNPNAPWSFRSELSYASDRTRLALGLTATRNYALPLYMFQPLGSSVDLTPPTSAFARPSRTTDFVISARMRQTLKQLSGGETVDLVGDVFIPVTFETPNTRVREAPLIRSTTGRLGIGFGF